MRVILLAVFGLVYGLLALLAGLLPLGFLRSLAGLLLGVLVKVVGFNIISLNAAPE